MPGFTARWVEGTVHERGSGPGTPSAELTRPFTSEQVWQPCSKGAGSAWQYSYP